MTDPTLEQTSDAEASAQQTTIDPMKQEMLLQSLRENQRLGPSIWLGLLAAIAGAFIWALITYSTDFQIGWMAIGLGFGVAYVVRTVGHGVDPIFGYWSAGLSLIGCVLGNVLVVGAVIANEEEAPLSDVMFALFAQPHILFEALTITFDPIDILFYGLAVYYGYKFAFRTVTPADLTTLSR